VPTIDRSIFHRARRDNLDPSQLEIDYPGGNKKRLRLFYKQQNELIAQFLSSGDEEQMTIEENTRLQKKINLAIYGSSAVNFIAFVVQLYAAIATNSLSVNIFPALYFCHSKVTVLTAMSSC
jgi:hypothetical protein